MKKQIEEMAKDMCEYYYKGTCYQDKKPCDCKCDIFSDAQYLYYRGYRKASDVAMKIFADIDTMKLQKDFTSRSQDFKFGYMTALIDIAELKKKYESEGEK